MTRALSIIGIVLGCAFVVTMFVVAGVAAYREHRRCIDNGGHWERRNCHQVESQICTTTDWGNGMFTTSCYPTTTTECDRVCIGANAEAR